MKSIRIRDITIDENAPPILIAGPCVIEDETSALQLADQIASLPIVQKYTFVFKASYSKDNRSSSVSYRGPGLEQGLEILDKVKSKVGCPVLSDVHSSAEVGPAAEVLDVIQIPAFMSRQTSLLEAAARSGRAVNIKKGQFLSPQAAGLAVDKVRMAGGQDVLLTERGTTFGYQDLVVDFRSFPRMRAFGCPIIFDVTHSLQKPSELGDRSGGEPELAATMARAAAAVPCDGLFVETHPEPSTARSDAASMLPFAELSRLLEQSHQLFVLARELCASEHRILGR
ncbi:MAG: 3-deoxy-8-phosphooctulonate synthase [Candidatus Krumholzibacteria bacterium]|nr:3-deoxy-8-phosphooctulonate synthase [Candidatus Krumholzibacteria bacterium]